MRNSLRISLALALLVSVSVFASDLPIAKTAAPPEFAELLEKYVRPDGVRYSAWKGSDSDVQQLRKVVEFFASTRPPTQKDEALAWNLNAYNAWILERILAKYPTDGPMAGDEKFFDREQIVISGETLSFNQLEAERIRKPFNDPRVHFAVNCASRSCPPLDSKPFSGLTLDADLDRLSADFLNRNPEGIRVAAYGKRVQVTRLFEWYAADFGGRDAILPFINRYRSSPIPKGATLDFFEYNWALNGSRD